MSMVDASTAELLLVALGGGLGANLLGALTKGAEFSREDRSRWLEQRRAAYAGFLSAQRTLEFRGMQLALMRRLGPITEQLERDREQVINAAREEARQHLDQLELLAPAGVRKVAIELDQAVATMVQAIEIAFQDDGSVTASAYEPHRQKVDQWSAEFLRHARRDLRAPREWPRPGAWRPSR
jgi:hypothetical protein